MTDRTDPFAALSEEERARYGSPDNWRLEGYVGPRAKGDSAQFSLRLPRDEFDALKALADERRVRFSDLVRDALKQYLRAEDQPRINNTVVRVTTGTRTVVYLDEAGVDRSGYGVDPAPHFSFRGDQPVELTQVG